jgi:hypothetical protein
MTIVRESPSGPNREIAVGKTTLLKSVTLADFVGNETDFAEINVDIDLTGKLPLAWLVVIEQPFALPNTTLTCNLGTYPDGAPVDQSPSDIVTDTVGEELFQFQSKGGSIHAIVNPLPLLIYFESDGADVMSQLTSGIMHVYLVYMEMPSR